MGFSRGGWKNKASMSYGLCLPCKRTPPAMGTICKFANKIKIKNTHTHTQKPHKKIPLLFLTCEILKFYLPAAILLWVPIPKVKVTQVHYSKEIKKNAAGNCSDSLNTEVDLKWTKQYLYPPPSHLSSLSPLRHLSVPLSLCHSSSTPPSFTLISDFFVLPQCWCKDQNYVLGCSETRKKAASSPYGHLQHPASIFP